MGGELAAVSRSLNETWQVLAILGWKVVELGLGWFGDYDDVDIAALAVLSHVPHLYFLTAFYNISAQTATLSLIINVLSISIPTRLLRRRSPTHDAAAPASAVPNRFIMRDLPTRIATSVLAAAIYGVILYGSQRSWLPVFLVTHFDGLRSLQKAHEAIFPLLIATMIPVGWAAREFLFLPALAARGEEDAIRELERRGKRNPSKEFDPATASLSETLWWNFWGWKLHQKVLINRTAVLLVFSGLNVWMQTFVAVEGSDIIGAAGWASLWAIAGMINAEAFSWVSNV
jgi:hypothetical protein